MQRYFVEKTVDNKIEICGEDARHIVKVMRMTSGDKVLCCTKEGKTALSMITEIANDCVLLEVEEWQEEEKELPVSVTIANGLPKGDKLELVIQKGTELGAAEFIPFIAARSIVKWDSKKASKKVERFKKIAKEAAEQSHRTVVPSVVEPCSLNKLIEVSETYTHKIVAYEEEAKRGEKANFASILSRLQKGDSIIIVVGPEGGLTEEEVEKLRQANFVPCSFGPRILRTETAPFYALSAVSYETELMR